MPSPEGEGRHATSGSHTTSSPRLLGRVGGVSQLTTDSKSLRQRHVKPSPNKYRGVRSWPYHSNLSDRRGTEGARIGHATDNSSHIISPGKGESLSSPNPGSRTSSPVMHCAPLPSDLPSLPGYKSLTHPSYAFVFIYIRAVGRRGRALASAQFFERPDKGRQSSHHVRRVQQV